MAAQTLYDKLWQSHLVHEEKDGTALIYIDRHLVHEVTSAQAYEGLKLAKRKLTLDYPGFSAGAIQSHRHGPPPGGPPTASRGSQNMRLQPIRHELIAAHCRRRPACAGRDE